MFGTVLIFAAAFGTVESDLGRFATSVLVPESITWVVCWAAIVPANEGVTARVRNSFIERFIMPPFPRRESAGSAGCCGGESFGTNQERELHSDLVVGAQ